MSPEFVRGAWAAFNLVLNHLNTYDTKVVNKSVLYRNIMRMRPEHLKENA